MKHIFYIAAQVWSVLFYPLWIPTYGMILLATTFGRQNVAYWTICVISTFIITAFIPLLLILYLKHRGVVNDLYIDNAAERTIPYRYTAVCYAMWCYLIGQILHMPAPVLTIGIGSTVLLILVTLINRHWKISAHLSGLGGLIGGIAACCLHMGYMPGALFVTNGIIISLLTMYARLYLRAHTSMQVVTGYLLGIVCTFIPYLIIHYVQAL